MNLSERMEAVVSLVPENAQCVADIGCDHAYVSIVLVERAIAKKVIAMDVRKGPLEIATQNIIRAGYESVIDIRLSNGLEGLSLKEADTVVIAGMGGLLITEILSRSMEKLRPADGSKGPVLVLQPQSELYKLRKFLLENQYSITKENVVIDEGKYYTVMMAQTEILRSRDGMSYHLCHEYDRTDFLYGRYNLLHQNEILKQYLLHEKDTLNDISDELDGIKRQLEQNGKELSQRTEKRLEEVKQAIKDNQKGLQYYPD